MKIKYVGKKPFVVDRVSGSGKTWNGNGDVQQVTDKQGEILLKYPDQWADADDSADGMTGKYSAMTRVELMDECESREIEYSVRSKRAELIATLEEHDADSNTEVGLDAQALSQSQDEAAA